MERIKKELDKLRRQLNANEIASDYSVGTETTLSNTTVVDSGISWEYFFGGGKIPYQHHYYKATLNGIRVEKHTFRGGVEYSVGNMDNAKIKYKTEMELIDAITIVECLKCQPGMPCPFCNGSGFLMPNIN